MLQKLFGYDPRTMSIKKEIVGGITTFLTMAYILAVNPMILGDAGMNKETVFIATTVSAAIATLVMAIYAKLPFALAAGMGLNAFFAYTICGAMGYSWQFALTAVFIEGIIFVLLTITGLRDYIVNSIPATLRNSISPGIGMFIALIGLNNAGIIITPTASLPVLGDFTSTPVLLACLGIFITSMLIIKKVTGGILWGILITAVIGIPLGVTHITGIVDVPHATTTAFMDFQWEGIISVDMLICVMTLLFMDIFDTIGSLIGVCNQARMVDENGNIPNMKKAFMADAIGTVVGAMLGTSTVTTFVESASGVNAGGRSGLTAFTTAICFLFALFLAPVFLSVPSQATAPVLFLVGVVMMQDITKIDFTDLATAIPCFVCIFMMALTSSISNGIMLGLIAYVVIHVLLAKWEKMNIGMYILAILFALKFLFL